MPVFDYRQIGTGSLIAEDFYVQNVTLGNESKIIKAQSLKSFRMKNNIFSKVQPRQLSDTTTKLIELSSLVITDQLNYTIEDIYIEQSALGFIELLGVSSSLSLSSNFIIQNFTYAHSKIEFPHDLISFIRVETSNDFQISLSDINMLNITFSRYGNLMNYEHQTYSE